MSFAVACGGGEEDETIDIPGPGDDNPDDPPDDPPPPPPEENPPATGIGAICSETQACPESAPVCLAFSQGATSGVCTAICGETPIPEGGEAEPPDPTLDQTCPTYSGPATSMCVLGLTGEPGATTQEWACALLCGTYNSPQGPIELGECDGGLTCGAAQANLCSP